MLLIIKVVQKEIEKGFISGLSSKEIYNEISLLKRNARK